MSSLVIVAKISGAVAMPWHPTSLDSLLMAAVAVQDNLPPLAFVPEDERKEVEIPLDRTNGIYLCTTAIYSREVHERRWLNRRFPVAEAQMFGSPKVRRINMSAGACRSYRMPLETVHLENDEMMWFARGDLAKIEELLLSVCYIGKKRSVGLGKVLSWQVGEVEPWDGFPVVRDGQPLRPLPLEWPGIAATARRDYRVLVPPYYERWREQECVVPS